jgi:hypothetical protein
MRIPAVILPGIESSGSNQWVLSKPSGPVMVLAAFFMDKGEHHADRKPRRVRKKNLSRFSSTSMNLVFRQSTPQESWIIRPDKTLCAPCGRRMKAGA